MSDHPTPITDAFYGQSEGFATVEEIIKSHANLERQLAEAKWKLEQSEAAFYRCKSVSDEISEQWRIGEESLKKQLAEARAEIEIGRNLWRASSVCRELTEQRDEWKRSHDHVCKELASCEDDRDQNAKLCEEARQQRDRLAEALRMCERHLSRHESESLGDKASELGWMVLCDVRATLATLARKEEE